MTYRNLYYKYSKIARESGLEENGIKLLILELSKLSRVELIINYDEKVEEETLEKILVAFNKYLKKKIPVQYILGYTYFYGMQLFVNQNVLIPRPETEELVDYIIRNNPFSNPLILDIGTGSGAIAIALKKHLDNSTVSAVDISSDALNMAKINAVNMNQEINFIHSDVFSSVSGKYNILVSNPPYIDGVKNVASLVLNNEPHLALFAEEEGLYFYKKILKESSNYLENTSLIAFEIPEDKDEDLMKIANLYYGDSEIKIIKDLQNKSRILVIKTNWR